MDELEILTPMLAPRHAAPACGCFGSDHDCPSPVRDTPIDRGLFELCYAESYLIAPRSALKLPARG